MTPTQQAAGTNTIFGGTRLSVVDVQTRVALPNVLTRIRALAEQRSTP